MYDLVIIGAGLSGLQAAYTAKQAGLSVAVLEARARVGGKVWTVPLASGRGFADLGAAWVNDSLQPLVWSYVQRFGLKTTTQPIDGLAIMQMEDGRMEFPFGIVPDVGFALLHPMVCTEIDDDSFPRTRSRTSSRSATTSRRSPRERRLHSRRMTRYRLTST